MEESEVKDLFGYNLKRIRKERNVSQMQLAESVNMVFTFISDIENGKKWISAETISKLSVALDVEPYQFFLPKDFEFKQNSSIASFANDLSDAFKKIRSQYIV